MWLCWLALSAEAQDPTGEHGRLGSELVKLAQRNTWSGVERTYRSLVALGVPLTPQQHLLGAQAALTTGETLLAAWRLRRVPGEAQAGASAADVDAVATAASLRETIAARYGLVSVYVGQGSVPALFRDDMPFAQQEQDSITAAQRTVGTTRAFAGLLPVGTYRIDAETFTVEPGPDWLVVAVGAR